MQGDAIPNKEAKAIEHYLYRVALSRNEDLSQKCTAASVEAGARDPVRRGIVPAKASTVGAVQYPRRDECLTLCHNTYRRTRWT